MSATGLKPDVICESCGSDYFYDEGGRCWRCDSHACPHCLEGREPLCPECRAKAMASVEPMLAVGGEPPSDPENWAAEFKWDGIRALAHWDGRTLRLESRNLNPISHRYPELDVFASLVGETPVVLDGEIVALDEAGRPSFPLLQKRMHASAAKARRLVKQVPVFYFVFDLLNENGVSLLDKPYSFRRERLEVLGVDHPRVRLTSSFPGRINDLLDAARAHQLEGVIAKRLDSVYRPGHRSRTWLKLKIDRGQEFVIGGWKPGSGGEETVGSLLLGVYGPDGLLHYAGKAGTGFDASEHRKLVELFTARRRNDSPFADDPGDPEVQYVRPDLVTQVNYRRWPAGQTLQQASYKGLRDDKPAHHVVDERGEEG